MPKLLINMRLSDKETEMFEKVFARIIAKPGKPPTKTDVVKALMGFDYFNLLDDSEREYLSGRLESLPEWQQIPAGARPGDKMRARKTNI